MCLMVVKCLTQVSTHGHLEYTGQKMGMSTYTEKPSV